MSVFVIAQENEDKEVGLYTLMSYILLLPPHYFFGKKACDSWTTINWH